ncbi:MAG: DUF1571 domain-containing protein [Flavobacteriales bacterium]|nr:DUF1571 domain-containing protein [Flavobacteriales bacterium]
MCASFSEKEYKINNEEVIVKMISAIKSIKTLKYTLKNTERINGKLLTGLQEIKYQASPLKCYVHMKSPNPGSELLFVKGVNNNKAIYNPNGFPYFKMNLDPMGSLMRKNNHHTIYEVGFKTMAKIITKGYKEKNYSFTYKGDTIWNRINCHIFSISNTNFKIKSYTVKEKETIKSIAKKYQISEYMILELNQKLSDFNDDLTLNQKIMIPTTYAKEIELYIDKKTFLPVFQKISDNKGLYEQYEYSNLKLNPTISDEEFTPAIFD